MSHRVASPLELLKQRDLLNRSRRTYRHRSGLMESLEPRRLFAAGTIDPTFGVQDVSLGSLSLVHKVVVQSDGKLLVAGPTRGTSSTRPFSAYRYSSNGTPDTTFGNGGIASFSGPGSITDVHNFAILPSGKILAIGQTAIAGGGTTNWDFFVARLNANGTLDTSFGTGGMVHTDVGSNEDICDSVVPLSDGRFYIGGASNGDYAVVRYNANGSLDTSFAGDGIATVSGIISTATFGVTVSGKPVLAAVDDFVTGRGTQVVRLTSAGALDPSFSGDGRQSLQGFFVSDFLVSGEDLLLAGGGGSVNLMRLRHDGAKDTGFGPGGLRAFSIPGNNDVRLQDVALQVDGKILVSGATAPAGGNLDGFVARFTAGGVIDTSFNYDGVFGMDAGGVESFQTIAPLSDGRIMIGGYVAVGSSVFPVLGRLIGEPVPVGGPTATIEGGILVARGTDGSDEFFIRRAGVDQVSIEIRYGAGQTRTATFDMDDFTGLRLEGFDGNDTFHMVDALVSPAVRNTTIVGAAGNDTIDYSSRTAAMRFIVDPTGGNGDFVPGMTSGAQADQFADVETIIGGSGNDTFYYGQRGEVIDGATKATFRLEGRGGNDAFHDACWPDGDAFAAVSMFGGNGNDSFSDESDNNFTADFFFGEAGDDTAGITENGPRKGRLDGGSGIDTIFFGTNVEQNFSYGLPAGFENGFADRGSLYGNELPNRLEIGEGTIYGGGGNDTMIGERGADNEFHGGDGTDTVDYSARTDSLNFSFRPDHIDQPELGEPFHMTAENETDVFGFDVEVYVGGSGDDRFVYGGRFPDEDLATLLTFDGRGGNDTFTDLSEFDPSYIVLGGDGDDRIKVDEPGRATIFGGNGNDTFTYEDNSPTPGTLSPGAGIDKLVFSLHSIPPTVFDMRQYPDLENVKLSEGLPTTPFTVIGNDLPNTIDASAIDSDPITLQGMGGNDTLIGGTGSDLLEGGDGDDLLAGGGSEPGSAGDSLFGGAGDNALIDGPLTLLPNFTFENGVLTFSGTDGDDQASLWADALDNLVIWLAGTSAALPIRHVARVVLLGNGGNDLLRLNPGLTIPALLDGGAGDDKLIGGAANDTLLGGDGNDHLTGNAGNDLLDGGRGSDAMFGKAGKDTVDYSTRTNKLIIGLDPWQDDGELGENDLTYFDIERVLGGRGNDRIGGSASNNELYGNDGNDTISGGGGNDALFGAAGSDKMDGGDGDDYLEGGAGHDTLYGGTGGDTLLGLAGNDRLLSDGDSSKDTVNGGLGTDSGDVDDLDEVLSIEIVL